jgi:phage repressor protein C with HTH and peptisase S24 domain
MLSHKGVWVAIDALAARRGLSASGLAKRAGLDPTTFNKSKRISREGKPRWPSTESVAKVLEATEGTLSEFVALIGEETGGASTFRLPAIGLAKAGQAGLFDAAGHPAGTGWDEVAFPDLRDPAAYALEVNGDALLPIYRDGDILIVSPAASIRRGDRVVVKTAGGDVMARQLARKSARRVELQALSQADANLDLDLGEIAWMARVVWVSQ